ncbi:MAG: cyclic nucleotide-binding domain-containing protein [Polyangiaceae bacterium]|nr:cyclic nucleotide-binding domain-containing protein [Polyangiaceae bacterium]
MNEAPWRLRLRAPTARALAALGQVLMVRPGEGGRSALCFLHLFLASAVFVLGRTVRDTLFLSRYSLGALPWMFVLYGVASAVTVVLYARFADRLARDRAIVVWCGVGVASYLATWVAVRAASAWIYPVFYVWSEVFANLAISQFWTLANDLYDARSQRRLYGPIGAARVLGVVVVGLGTSGIVGLIGTAQLLFVLAALLVGMALVARRLGQEPRAGLGRAARVAGPRRSDRVTPLCRDGYVVVLSAMLLCAFAALTVGDYQFKAIAREAFREDELARFFGLFYAATGVVAFLFQILVTPRVLGHFGVGAGMSVMPAVFGVASLLLLPFTVLPVATAMKFADNGFQYTIHETTLQSLYVPFARAVKARTRAFLDAVVKPLAYGVGGALLLALAEPLGPRWLALVSLGLVGAWFAIIPVVRRRYLGNLEATLSAAGLAALGAEPVMDAAGHKILVAALSAPDPRLVLAALDEIDSIPRPTAQATLERLLAHESPAVRVAALERLAVLGQAAPGPGDVTAETPAPTAVRRALADAVPEVRAAAATAHAALTGDEAIEALVPLLSDPVRSVRAAALSGVLAHGGFEGAMVGGQLLAALLGSEVRADRMDAASVLAALGRQGRRRLEALLADPDPGVRLEAVRAASSVADRVLVPALLRALGERHTAAAAAAALAAVGPAAVPALAALLASEDTPRHIRLELPRVLRGIACEESYAAVRAVTASPDSHLRLRAFAALSRLCDALRRPVESLATVRAWLEREIVETCHNLHAWERARPEFGTQLLDEAVDFRRVRGGRRVLRILELRCDREALRLVRERIEDPERRPNALEVLDTALEPALRGLVLPFFDDLPIADKARHFGLPPPPEPTEFMRAQCRHPNPYVALVALEALAQKRHALCGDEGRRALAHPDPMVREAGLRALCALPAEDAPAAMEQASRDPDPGVARLAAALRRSLRAGPVRPASVTAPPVEITEVVMYSTVEKLLLLRTAPVFAKLRSEDLAPLARIAEVERYQPGEPVFVEGEMGDALFVLVRGKIAISHGGEALATLGPGEAFGEMAVLDEAPRSASARAAEEVEVLRIGSEAFYEVLHEHAEIAEGVIRMLSQRLRETNEALEGRKHAEQRRAATVTERIAPAAAPAPGHDASLSAAATAHKG